MSSGAVVAALRPFGGVFRERQA
ncbi:MAG: hypothetical protein QOI47_2116, partial [Actinomycetota bacterium]|nr:hypothetical protein [Actinomycetota bacterium]